jgi:predicted signal transduction protein with EAL and GGDEF domain
VVVGVLFFVATCINDLMIDLVGFGSTRLVPFGFVAIMLAMSASLAGRLTAMLAGLEKAVAQRTEALSQANEQLAAAARIDPLTNLLNRRGFSEEATEEIHRMNRSGRGFNLLLADIDQFKSFNDLHGHACGDHVLQQAASIFQTKLRAVDRVGRWGGEKLLSGSGNYPPSLR